MLTRFGMYTGKQGLTLGEQRRTFKLVSGLPEAKPDRGQLTRWKPHTEHNNKVVSMFFSIISVII